MSDDRKSLNSPDEPEKQDLPVEAEQDLDKSKRKSGKIRKARRPSARKSADQAEQVESQTEEPESPGDDLFEDIRRSLKEEEVSKKEKKQKGIIQRVTRLIKPAKTLSTDELKRKVEQSKPEEAEITPAVDDVQKIIESAPDLSSEEENAPVAEAVETSEPEAAIEDVESMPAEQDVAEFILGLEPVEVVPEKPQDEPLPQPEPEENRITEATRGSEVLRTQSEKEKTAENFEAIREVALEDYGAATAQPEDAPVVTSRQKFRIMLRGMRPLDKVLIFGAVSLIFCAGMVGLGVMFVLPRIQAPAGPAVPTQDLPVPVRVTFTGGWEFDLTKGRVVDGRWSPRGAEWLEGTELCKWVAIPWSLQLEAVVRSLNSGDPIELTMSNADQLEYKVYSIEKVPVDQIDTLERKPTCLLLILANEDEDTRWVVTALP